jgi:cobalt-zinc-cadmium efflux system outer membrane protein
MGGASGESPVLAGTLEAGPIMTKKLLELKQLALEQRPDLHVLWAESRRGDAEIALARSEGVPNLTAGLAIRRDTTAMEIGGIEGKDTAYTIGVKLSLPIPLFDQNQAGIQEASARRNSAHSRWSTAGKTVEREVETASDRLQHADTILALYRTGIIPQLEENLQLTQEAYRLGEVGILTVIQEQKKFIDVHEGYLTALYGRQIALVKLESTVATDLTGGAQ